VSRENFHEPFSEIVSRREINGSSLQDTNNNKQARKI
jgi:hypothetical protein